MWRKNLKRFLSGLFLIPLSVIIALYTSAFWLTFTVSLIIIAALKEFTDITPRQGGRGLDIASVAAGAGLPFFFYAGRPEWVMPYLVCAVFLFFASRVFS
ncbi:MAG: hypothetical protein HY883_07920, partial [Deltaproteobacteria bacterium]|nr:hypothetical protein [Deltaproteobacteria bacterium]